MCIRHTEHSREIKILKLDLWYQVDKRPSHSVDRKIRNLHHHSRKVHEEGKNIQPNRSSCDTPQQPSLDQSNWRNNTENETCSPLKPDNKKKTSKHLRKTNNDKWDLGEVLQATAWSADRRRSEDLTKNVWRRLMGLGEKNCPSIFI